MLFNASQTFSGTLQDKHVHDSGIDDLNALMPPDPGHQHYGMDECAFLPEAIGIMHKFLNT